MASPHATLVLRVSPQTNVAWGIIAIPKSPHVNVVAITAQLMAAGYLMAISTVMGGWLSDKYGRRAVYCVTAIGESTDHLSPSVQPLILVWRPFHLV